MSASAGMRQDEVTEGRRAEQRFLCVHVFRWLVRVCLPAGHQLFSIFARARGRESAGAAACSNAVFSWTFPTSCDPGLVSGGVSRRTCKWRNPRLVKHEF